MGRARAYIGLGANLGDAPATLAAAIHALAALPGVHLVGVSRLYATAPVGVTDQPEFHNAVVALDVPSGQDPVTGALALLIALKGLERAFGRRDGPRWGPRPLDLDVLIFGRHVIRAARPPETESSVPAPAGSGPAPTGSGPAPAGSGPAPTGGGPMPAGSGPAPAASWLTVPHASARDRLFVLAPLADLAPGLRPPSWGESVAAARDRRLSIEGPAAVRPVARWDGVARAWKPLNPA